MYCEHCKAEIKGFAVNCPLCHRPLTEKEGPVAETSVAERFYPAGKTRRRRVYGVFSKIYLPLAFAATAACMTVNILRNPGHMWSVVVMIALIYVYFCLKFNVLTQRNFNGNILGQFMAQMAVFVTIRLIFGGNDWIFATWLPIACFLNEALLLIYIGIYRRDARKKIMSLISMCLMGIVPVCIAFILDLPVKWLSITVSSISAAVIILTLIFGGKYLSGQWKRFFHL